MGTLSNIKNMPGFEYDKLKRALEMENHRKLEWCKAVENALRNTPEYKYRLLSAETHIYVYIVEHKIPLPNTVPMYLNILEQYNTYQCVLTRKGDILCSCIVSLEGSLVNMSTGSSIWFPAIVSGLVQYNDRHELVDLDASLAEWDI